MSDEQKGVIIGQKVVHKNLFHLLANTPMTKIPLGDLFYLEIRSINETFNSIELKTNGLDNPQRYSSYMRPKIVQHKTKKGKDLLERDTNIPQEAQEVLKI